MATQPPKLPLSKDDYDGFVKAVRDDLQHSKGNPALQSWMNNLAEGKHVEGNKLFCKWADAIETLRQRRDAAENI